MLSTGFTVQKIRKTILSEQVLILSAGVVSGALSAIVATLPSLISGQDIPWIYLMSMILVVMLTGFLAIYFSVKQVSGTELISSLKKE